jgi:lysophospholipase L1-like esterase
MRSHLGLGTALLALFGFGCGSTSPPGDGGSITADAETTADVAVAGDAVDAGVEAGPDAPPDVPRRALRIWPIGDSITFGKGPPAPGGCGYRDPLAVSLAGSGVIDATFVGTLLGGQDVDTCPVSGIALASDGHSGFKSVEVAEQLADWYKAIGSADVVLLHVGANDVVGVATGRRTIEEATADFNAALTALASLDGQMVLFVSTLLNLPTIASDTLAAFNANVAAQVDALRASGRRVYLVDMSNVTNGARQPADGADFNSGGFHPVTSGYIKMAARWNDDLLKVFGQ